MPRQSFGMANLFFIEIIKKKVWRNLVGSCKHDKVGCRDTAAFENIMIFYDTSNIKEGV